MLVFFAWENLAIHVTARVIKIMKSEIACKSVTDHVLHIRRDHSRESSMERDELITRQSTKLIPKFPRNVKTTSNSMTLYNARVPRRTPVHPPLTVAQKSDQFSKH